jgi:hypothetical protein
VELVVAVEEEIQDKCMSLPTVKGFLRKLVKLMKPKIHRVQTAQTFSDVKTVLHHQEKNLETRETVGLKNLIMCGKLHNMVQSQEQIE